MRAKRMADNRDIFGSHRAAALYFFFHLLAGNGRALFDMECMKYIGTNTHSESCYRGSALANWTCEFHSDLTVEKIALHGQLYSLSSLPPVSHDARMNHKSLGYYMFSQFETFFQFSSFDLMAQLSLRVTHYRSQAMTMIPNNEDQSLLICLLKNDDGGAQTVQFETQASGGGNISLWSRDAPFITKVTPGSLSYKSCTSKVYLLK